jgi:hypothetical protein
LMYLMCIQRMLMTDEDVLDRTALFRVANVHRKSLTLSRTADIICISIAKFA